ncbi:unannotated protein [freshwater metagenome]|uniref:Unannotated protein n=1 Tax=freshwater metagenome TaxID=449393 RepID=A0A6J7J3K6_9ZZZZ
MAHDSKRGERASPERSHGSAPLSTRPSSRPSTAGSSVSVAASTNTTASMIPSAIDRNAGLGTSITAVSEIRTVMPEKRTALPAVSIVSTTTRTGSPCSARAARKRMTMKRA